MERIRPTQGAVERALSTLKQAFSGIEGVQSCAFFGLSPVVSKAEEPDLDVIVLITERADMGKIEEALQRVANESGLPVDPWVLDREELLMRMQRIAAIRQQPLPQKSPSNWTGPAFIAIYGLEILSEIIRQANVSPVNEALIPPDPLKKKLFRPL